MRRFFIVKDGKRIGEGCRWTDGGYHLILESQDVNEPGGAWNEGEYMSDARKWLADMGEPTATIEMIDPEGDERLAMAGKKETTT